MLQILALKCKSRLFFHVIVCFKGHVREVDHKGRLLFFANNECVILD